MPAFQLGFHMHSAHPTPEQNKGTGAYIGGQQRTTHGRASCHAGQGTQLTSELVTALRIWFIM